MNITLVYWQKLKKNVHRVNKKSINMMSVKILREKKLILLWCGKNKNKKSTKTLKKK